MATRTRFSGGFLAKRNREREREKSPLAFIHCHPSIHPGLDKVSVAQKKSQFSLLTRSLLHSRLCLFFNTKPFVQAALRDLVVSRLCISVVRSRTPKTISAKQSQNLASRSGFPEHSLSSDLPTVVPSASKSRV